MRENIFRGRDNKSVWHYGFEDYCPIATGFFIHEVGDTAPTMQDPCGGCYSERFEVDPKTIGQYINKDYEDGTQMFEGDIVECLQTETNFIGGQMADLIKVESLIGVITFQDGQIGVLSDGLFYADALKNAPTVDKLGTIHDSTTND